MQQLVLISFLIISSLMNGQQLYIKTYGNKADKTIIFIHGGPSGNSTLFEGTTAQQLANKGFHVLVYDRRGEGRSADSNAKFTYEEAIQDLNTIYNEQHLQKAILIGHSFGGLVATLFTEKHPQKVSALVMAGALFSQQETYNHILNTLTKKYTADQNTEMLSKINSVEKLDKNSAVYRKECFNLAGKNDYFKMPNPTEASKKIYQDYESGIYSKTNIRNQNAPLLFYKNERRNNIDTQAILNKIKQSGIPIYAIYGKDDGIFSPKQLHSIESIAGKSHFVLLENCSHYLFADQQNQFLTHIEKWLK